MPALWIFSIILTISILYYVYDNFVKEKAPPVSIPPERQAELDGSHRLASTYGFIFTVITIAVTFLFVMNEHSGDGMLGIFFYPFWLFCFFYFIVLSSRYATEKSSMYVLDKLTFYILLVVFIVWLSPAIPGVLKLF